MTYTHTPAVTSHSALIGSLRCSAMPPMAKAPMIARMTPTMPLSMMSPPRRFSGGIMGLGVSVAVVIRLIGTLDGNTDICRLLGGQFGQFGIQGGQLQPRHLLVQMLGQGVDPDRVLAGVGVQLDLGDGLIGERGTHHVGG